MVTDEIIIYEANEYLKGNRSIAATATSLGITKKTLQLHFIRLKLISEKLYRLVEEKKESNQIEGRVKGGEIGKSHSKYTKQQAEEIATKMIDQNLTYKEAEELFGIPKSTIYELVHGPLVSKELKDALDVLAEANIHDTTIEELSRRKR